MAPGIEVLIDEQHPVIRLNGDTAAIAEALRPGARRTGGALTPSPEGLAMAADRPAGRSSSSSCSGSSAPTTASSALKNQVANAWKQIDVQLKRRHDLIPNLVNTVKGAMDFERDTLEAVISARNKAVSATGVAADGEGRRRADPGARAGCSR